MTCNNKSILIATTDRLRFSLQEVQILLVVDRSTTMGTTLAGFEQNKWETLKTVLVTGLGQTEKTASFGLELFPPATDPDDPVSVDCGDRCCDMPSDTPLEVPIDPNLTGVTQVLEALDRAVPGGSRPTAKALERAYRYLTATTSAAGTDHGGGQYVLLITDGGPLCNASLTCGPEDCGPNLDGTCNESSNCCTDQPESCVDQAATLEQVNALAGAGIATVVVGLPGSDAYAPYLDELAQAGLRPRAGGSPSYFALGSDQGPGAMAEVLTSILTQIGSACAVAIDDPWVEPSRAIVTVDCEAVPGPAELGSGSAVSGSRWGWYATVRSKADGDQEILLGGSACRLIQDGRVQRVDLGSTWCGGE
jgi:hypothetical protein